jgi:hypothetical protein
LQEVSLLRTHIGIIRILSLAGPAVTEAQLSMLVLYSAYVLRGPLPGSALPFSGDLGSGRPSESLLADAVVFLVNTWSDDEPIHIEVSNTLTIAELG